MSSLTGNGFSKTGMAVCLALTMSLSATGCSNIHDDSTRTKTEGTLTGAGVGAAVGALLGLAIGGNTEGTLLGAAIGAGVDSLSGFMVGKHVADKKAEYARREDWLDDCIDHARTVTAESKKKNDSLRQKIAALDKESKDLQTAYKKKQIKSQQLAKERKNIESLQKETNENIKVLKEEKEKQLAVAKDAKSGNNTKEAKILDAEIQKLNKEIKQMEDSNKKLANISARLAV